MDGKPLIQQFEDAVDKVMDDFIDQGLTVGEMIGVLELVKLDFWYRQQDLEDIF